MCSIKDGEVRCYACGDIVFVDVATAMTEDRVFCENCENLEAEEEEAALLEDQDN